jgi:hypothetical protein
VKNEINDLIKRLKLEYLLNSIDYITIDEQLVKSENMTYVDIFDVVNSDIDVDEYIF